MEFAKNLKSKQIEEVEIGIKIPVKTSNMISQAEREKHLSELSTLRKSLIEKARKDMIQKQQSDKFEEVKKLRDDTKRKLELKKKSDEAELKKKQEICHRRADELRRQNEDRKAKENEENERIKESRKLVSRLKKDKESSSELFNSNKSNTTKSPKKSPKVIHL